MLTGSSLFCAYPKAVLPQLSFRRTVARQYRSYWNSRGYAYDEIRPHLSEIQLEICIHEIEGKAR